MPPDKSSRYDLSVFRNGKMLARLIGIGIIVGCSAVAFAAVAGWLSPDKLTPASFVDGFQQANGVHPGFRRNHAKGVCIAGNFASNGQGVRLSKSVIFQPGIVPVVGRFALAGGMPMMADGPKAVRSMALSFRPANGEEWRTGMNDIPVFPFPTPADFYGQMQAAMPDPATGKPDPAKMKAFVDSHPKTAQAMKAIGAKPFSSGFADASYNSLDAFRFVNKAGTVMPVRWTMAAVDPFVAQSAEQPQTGDKNYLFDALAARLKQGPVQWHLIVTIGQADDPTNDATVAWPDDREKVDVGTLTIDRIASEAKDNCRDINFDPLVLPSGIEASDDPLLSARSAVYSRSFTRRAGEDKTPSAVQIDNTAKEP
ncbi:catalase family peroxidase [Dongia soli]|uniref:Catalase-related peroxidase n=1 Tax=Dongia soli TaxID=600628 RepID=A0ABU5E8F7_9PROT|nr:catalase family peroxidase [Dongia soli]MDY0882039.1 catalase family peroxidase [Dongia soli]